MLHFGGIILQDRFETIPGPKLRKCLIKMFMILRSKKLSTYFSLTRSVAFKRHSFYKLDQKENELVGEFAHWLRKQAMKCPFKSDVDVVH